jgi:ATP-binding cassette, subfamily B, bacterial
MSYHIFFLGGKGLKKMSEKEKSSRLDGDKGYRIDLESTKNLMRAVRLVWDSAPGWTAAQAVLIIIQGLLPLASLFLMKLIVDAVTLGATSDDKQAALTQVFFLIALAGAIAILIAICNSAATITSANQSALVSDHIQSIMHAKSVQTDLEYYETPGYYDIFHRAQIEAPSRPIRIVNGVVQVARSAVSLMALAALLLSLSWVLGAVLVLAAIPGAIVRRKSADQMFRWQEACTSKQRRAWYLHSLLTGDGHAKEIRLFDLGSIFMSQYRELQEQIRKERLNILYRRSLIELAAQGIAIVGVFVSLGYIAYQAVLGSITLGSLVMYFGAFQQGQSYLNSLMSGIAGLYEDNLFLSSFYEFLDLESKVKEPDNPQTVPKPINEGITLENVNFRYTDSPSLALEDVSFQIKPGQVVALVGENGSGKTTLIKLLCRLYDPESGRITIDGIDIRNFLTTDLRKEISIIFQDYARYNLTARQNIWLGDVECSIDDEKIIRSSQNAGADDVISNLEKGYETTLGKRFDDGVDLSIGEWQKVALARAFLRESQIIIMDEPTSALDAMAEEDVFRKFRTLAEGRTAIIISHRLSAVRMADCIYFLEKGKIKESGTHDELIALDGGYAKLFEVQASHYR